MSPCLCSYKGTWLRTEMPTAGVRSSTGKQECSTFPQRGFQHGSESLHMHCTYSASLSKRQYAETSHSSTGAYLCVTLGLRINGKAYPNTAAHAHTIPCVNFACTNTSRPLWNELAAAETLQNRNAPHMKTHQAVDLRRWKEALCVLITTASHTQRPTKPKT